MELANELFIRCFKSLHKKDIVNAFIPDIPFLIKTLAVDCIHHKVDLYEERKNKAVLCRGQS